MDMHVQDEAAPVTLETLAMEPIWVAWQLQEDGDRPPKKMPYNARPGMKGAANAHFSHASRQLRRRKHIHSDTKLT